MANRLQNRLFDPRSRLWRSTWDDDYRTDNPYGQYVERDERDIPLHGDYRGERDTGGQPAYGRQSRPGHEQQSGRDWGSSARGDYSRRSDNWGSHWGPGRYYGDPDYQRGEGPHRGKGPKNYQRSTERAREILCERLSDDPYIDASEVDVKVQAGRITLEGTVPDRSTKYAIEDVAEQIGIDDLQNNLRVQR